MLLVPLLETGDVAVTLRLDKRTVQRMFERGLIPGARRVGATGKLWRISQHAFKAYLDCERGEPVTSKLTVLPKRAA